LQHLAVRYRLARVQYQAAQQLEILGRQPHAGAPYAHSPRREIRFQIARRLAVRSAPGEARYRRKVARMRASTVSGRPFSRDRVEPHSDAIL
jgi:hypothetical protein